MYTKGLFGSVAIHWMAVDIHFFSGYPVFGLEGEVDSQNLARTVVEDIPRKVLDGGNTLVGSRYPHPNRFSPSLPPRYNPDQISSSYRGGRQ
jgi:hypothetical protein